MKKRSWMGVVVVLMALTLALVYQSAKENEKTQTISYNRMMDYIEKGQVVSAVIERDMQVELTMQDGAVFRAPHPGTETFRLMLLEKDVNVREKGGADFSPWLLVLCMVPLMLTFWRRGAVSLARTEKGQVCTDIPDVNLSHVAANEEAVRCMRELVDFLKEPDKYTRYGARLPRGVLLYGPPGTGKTLLARALAGEAQTPFFSMNGSDFVQVYVGVGASRVRELFRKARKAGGGVIFIDEIDAIGKKRDSGSDEREQTLNALLTEMSGFSSQEGIVVLAATNRLDTLDEALLRAGRFDRQIEVGLPDRQERLKILQVHARQKPMAQDVSLATLASRTTLFSGAQLESLLNEAAICAARRGEGLIAREDVDKAYLHVLVGAEKASVGPRFDVEKRITAYHEAGHALVMHVLLPNQRVTRLSVLPSGKGAAGYTLSQPEESMYQTKGQLKAALAAALAGRVAEEMIFGADEVTTGASGDIRRARAIAGRMAREWDMGDTGEAVKDEQALYREGMERARKVLNDHRDLLHTLADELICRETLDEERFLRIVKNHRTAIISA